MPVLANLLMACSNDGDVVADCFPVDAPMCGEQCTHPCGCRCNDTTGPRCFGDQQLAQCVHLSQGACYQPVAQCVPGGCLDAPNGAAHCATDCAEVRESYADVLADGHIGFVETGSAGIAPGPYNFSYWCEPTDCSTTTTAHCELGLGVCWYLGKPIERLNRLAEAYQALGCPANASCDCPAPTHAATCEAKDGGWLDTSGPITVVHRSAWVVE